MLLYGDPMFYGLARYVCDKLGKERFVVVPHVSSMQLAFARVMETWEEAYLTDLAKHPLDSVLEKIRTAQKVGLFTTDSCGPAASGEGAARSPHRLLHGLRLRKPRRSRRTRHPRHARGNRRPEVSTRST